jgi:AraC family transcriptional regulator, regulatory protein of adaptative response / methylated-DNA-[protein]-cysteine methyltransferase
MTYRTILELDIVGAVADADAQSGAQHATSHATHAGAKRDGENAMWRAVLARDAAADGQFFYAVRTTGVYCRPSCASRRPRRENVLFFVTAQAAEQAGFRACRRCHPRDAATDPSLEAVQKACAFIASREIPPTLAEIGAQVGLSPAYLQRRFTQVMGVSPRQYAAAQRVARAKARLKEGESVTATLYAAGFGSSRGFYEQTPDQLGMRPAAYRAGAQGQRIAYTIVASSLGRLLVAATGRGLCALRFDDSGGDEALLAELRAEFPRASIERDDALLTPEANAILEHLAGQRPVLDLPLDVQATAFQARVWAALRAIPYGQTRSYTQVADAIGEPTAVRAVAHACAHNPVALVVPCHRVVQADGRLAGYRWGVERKRTLLAREAGGAEATEAAQEALAFAAD